MRSVRFFAYSQSESAAEREEDQPALARMSFVFIAFGVGSSAVLGSAVICGSPERETRRFRPHG